MSATSPTPQTEASSPVHSLKSPILTQLRERTRPCHDRLERRLPIATEGVSLAQYEALLGAFHGFYAPLEARLERIASAIDGLDWHARRKLPWLAADLRALGIDDGRIGTLPACPALPRVASTTEALGCLYVLEGATLGAQVIRPRVREDLGPMTPATFFSAYGRDTGTRWREFLHVLAGVCHPDEVDSAVATAIETFVCLERWLEIRGVLR